jgi:hypothetical protein
MSSSKKNTDKIILARSLTNYNLIIIDIIMKRDAFDESPEGKKLKSLQELLALCRRKMKTIGQKAETDYDNDAVPPPPDPVDDMLAILNADILRKEEELKQLLAVRQEMVDRLKQTRWLYADTQKNLRTLQSSKAKSATSLETKLFKY